MLRSSGVPSSVLGPLLSYAYACSLGRVRRRKGPGAALYDPLPPGDSLQCANYVPSLLCHVLPAPPCRAAVSYSNFQSDVPLIRHNASSSSRTAMPSGRGRRYPAHQSSLTCEQRDHVLAASLKEEPECHEGSGIHRGQFSRSSPICYSARGRRPALLVSCRA